MQYEWICIFHVFVMNTASMGNQRDKEKNLTFAKRKIFISIRIDKNQDLQKQSGIHLN